MATVAWTDTSALRPSDRVQRLKARLDRRLRASGHRILSDPQEARVLAEAIRRAYEATEGEPTILRRARVLTEYARSCPASAHSDELLVGNQTFNPLHGPAWTQADREALPGLGWAMTAAHIVHDYESMLLHGIADHRQAIQRRLARARGDEAVNLRAFAEALEAFATFVDRHAAMTPRLADVIGPLIEGPPQTFHQALQLVWFVQVFLHVENPGVAISFGRFDRYLWPFLEADLEAGRIDLQDAFDLACAFLLKCCVPIRKGCSR